MLKATKHQAVTCYYLSNVLGHSVSNQPLVVRVTSQIWLKLISKVHKYV